MSIKVVDERRLQLYAVHRNRSELSRLLLDTCLLMLLVCSPSVGESVTVHSSIALCRASELLNLTLLLMLCSLSGPSLGGDTVPGPRPARPKGPRALAVAAD